MAGAYETSYEHGQLAVSYVLAHYRHDQGLHSDPEELDGKQEELWGLVRQGLTITEQAQATNYPYDTITVGRRDLYSALHVSNWLAAARLAYELEVEPVTTVPEEDTPSLPSYDLVAFDLYTRGLKQPDVARLTGEYVYGVGHHRLPRTYKALGVADTDDLSPTARSAAAIEQSYRLGIFTPGLGLQETLADYPDAVAQFDKSLGRNQPFINPSFHMRNSIEE
jgi:hypothetical protein